MAELNSYGTTGITAEMEDMIHDEIVGLDGWGHSRSIATVSIDLQPEYKNPQTGEVEIGSESDIVYANEENEWSSRDFSASIETLDGRLYAVTLRISKYGKDGINGLAEILSTYKNLINKALSDLDETGKGMYPILRLTFLPVKFLDVDGYRYFAAFAQPGDFSEVPASSLLNAGGIRMVFEADDMVFDKVLIEEGTGKLTGESSATTESPLLANAKAIPSSSGLFAE